MSLFKVFDIAGSSMGAQSVRLNTTASNMANADVVASSPEQAYRGRHPVFATMLSQFGESAGSAGVRVTGITQSQAPSVRQHDPGNPLADEQGYVWLSNVNAVEEMVNMMSASRSYENSIEVLNTSKELLVRTLNIGQ